MIETISAYLLSPLIAPLVGAIIILAYCWRLFISQKKLITLSLPSDPRGAQNIVSDSWRAATGEYVLTLSPFLVYLCVAIVRTDFHHLVSAPEVSMASAVLCATALTKLSRFLGSSNPINTKSIHTRVLFAQTVLIVTLVLSITVSVLISCELTTESSSLILQTMTFTAASAIYFNAITKIRSDFH
jgi:hypothetical protein